MVSNVERNYDDQITCSDTSRDFFALDCLLLFSTLNNLINEGLTVTTIKPDEPYIDRGQINRLGSKAGCRGGEAVYEGERLDANSQ